MSRRAPSAGLLLLAFTPLVLAQLAFGQRIPVNDGLGWDGVRYAEMARRLPELLSARAINHFYLQRLLPSAIVYAALRALNATPTNQAIVRGFLALDTLLLLGIVVLWSRIGRALALGPRGSWLGFGALALSFAVARMPFFYPTLTDTTALFLGFLLLEGHLAERPGRVLTATLLGAFRSAGPGLLLLAAGYILMGLDAESRRLTNALPLLLAFAAQALDQRPLGRWRASLLLGLALVFSKLWLALAGPGLFDAGELANYFSSQGPSMGRNAYVIQGLAAALSMALLAALPRPATPAASPLPPPGRASGSSAG